MEPVYDVCGIDVHKAMLAVVVGRAGQGEAEWERRKFGTTRRELQHLGAWLQARGVRQVAMESTAQYWKPVWLALEPHFDLLLAQARSTKAPKGRKSDFRDAVRIVKRLLSDDLSLSFVPDAEQRLWRLLTRSRHQLVRDHVRWRSQIEGLLEEGQIKLSSVVSDLFGVSARRMLWALGKGETDLEKLVALADPQLHASREELREALDGDLLDLHRVLLLQFLGRLELIESQMQELSLRIGERLRAHTDVVLRLVRMPGLGTEAAEQIIAELGPQAAAFDSPAAVASWVGVCPGREESAGHSKSNRSPKGNRPMRRLLDQCAWAAVRTKGSYFQHLFRRLVPRLGVKKAIWAIAHRLLRVIWKILHDGVEYVEHGPLALDPRARERRKRKLVRELRHLGYTVQVSPMA